MNGAIRSFNDDTNIIFIYDNFILIEKDSKLFVEISAIFSLFLSLDLIFDGSVA